ncbi:uncharacterized protein MKK02DRAFT_32679 [Dioszegia hungarica]|uniref:Uncharacterized protein n=1 Tax=Dioszegia hungarica TaxID=4972 RepID=A0AA38H6T6_9TREE|nr:uncharacterized protein MKK02DRAFT_32679 [Dioszegia hungarica]KAI9635200.1 hypothetical protein MKK02DRAFT_32679 [Dioszegia hungarica]
MSAPTWDMAVFANPSRPSTALHDEQTPDESGDTSQAAPLKLMELGSELNGTAVEQTTKFWLTAGEVHRGDLLRTGNRFDCRGIEFPGTAQQFELALRQTGFDIDTDDWNTADSCNINLRPGQEVKSPLLVEMYLTDGDTTSVSVSRSTVQGLWRRIERSVNERAVFSSDGKEFRCRMLYAWKEPDAQAALDRLRERFPPYGAELDSQLGSQSADNNPAQTRQEEDTVGGDAGEAQAPIDETPRVVSAFT